MEGEPAGNFAAGGKSNGSTTPPPSPLSTQAPPPANGKGSGEKRIGQIFIIGNTITPDKIILSQLPFGSGEKLCLADSKEAARNLSRLKIFEENPPPEVKILEREEDEKYVDIEIDVSERPCNIYFWAVEESLEFTYILGQWGFCTAIILTEDDTFPKALLRFFFTGCRGDFPLAIDYFLQELREMYSSKKQ